MESMSINYKQFHVRWFYRLIFGASRLWMLLSLFFSVFIRAPAIVSCGDNVKKLAVLQADTEKVVAVLQVSIYLSTIYYKFILSYTDFLFVNVHLTDPLLCLALPLLMLSFLFFKKIS